MPQTSLRAILKAASRIEKAAATRVPDRRLSSNPETWINDPLLECFSRKNIILKQPMYPIYWFPIILIVWQARYTRLSCAALSRIYFKHK